MSFNTHTYLRPACLTDILYNNRHILRHHYNYSAGALLVYLDISVKCPLVNITQGFCFFPRTCSASISLICLECTHQFYQDSTEPGHIPKSLNKWNNVSNIVYSQPITHFGTIIYLEQFQKLFVFILCNDRLKATVNIFITDWAYMT